MEDTAEMQGMFERMIERSEIMIEGEESRRFVQIVLGKYQPEDDEDNS